MIDLRVADGVANVLLRRAPVNAINRAWVLRFHALLDELDVRDDWNVLHIRSALRLFSAGADLKEMRAKFASHSGVAALIEDVREYQKLFARIEAMPCLTIAEINGAATGGGFELALACDLRIIAEEARVGLPEVRLGLLPGAGGTQRLTRLCGRAVALRIIAGAELVDGRTALELGMAQWCVPFAEIERTTVAIVRRFADQPALAARFAKACVVAALGPDSGRGFDLEYFRSRELLESEETRGLVARFLEKKAAV
jgi:enoyl-CoA hydratase/carnithine racemase